MKSIIVLILFFAIVLSVNPISAFAHSGKTDSKGGHWNSATGEYHYHHGYSAHDHYDMDGDGIDDCPYEFDERVYGLSNTSDAYDKGYYTGKKDGYDSGYSDGVKNTKSEMEKQTAERIEEAKMQSRNSAYILSAIIGIPILVIYAFVSDMRRSKAERELQERINGLKAELNEQKNINTIQSSCSSIPSISGIPADVTVQASFTPIKGKKSASHPFGEYTVYISKSGTKYHYKKNCCNASSPAHIFDVCYSHSPCSICVPPNRKISEVPVWYKSITKSANK